MWFYIDDNGNFGRADTEIASGAPSQMTPAERTAALVAILRAYPSEAVEAVDACKVLRPWTPQGENEVRNELNGLKQGCYVGPVGTRGGPSDPVNPSRRPGAIGDYMLGRPDGWGRAPTAALARERSEAAWVAAGWVVAK